MPDEPTKGRTRLTSGSVPDLLVAVGDRWQRDDVPNEEEKAVIDLIGVDLESLRRSADARYAELRGTPPAIVYHYTGPQALLGMVASKAIWATNAKYLNDATELEYFDEVLARVAFPRTLRSDVAHELRQEFAHKRHLVDFFGSIFVASFSADGDVLSQWRAYARDGLGYAIGLDTAELPRVGEGWDDPRLLRVIYSADEQNSLLAPFLGGALELLDKLATDQPGLAHAAARIVSTAIDSYITHMLPVLKNSGFKEEDEWRITVWNSDAGHKELTQFRASSFGLTPYVLLRWGDGSKPLPLRRVVLGPRLASAEADDAAREFLHSSGYRLPFFGDDDQPGASFALARSAVSYRPKADA